MDCSLPGSSVHGILQAKILEWAAIPTPGDLPDSGINTSPWGLPRLLHWQEDSLPLCHPDCVDHNKLRKALKEMGVLDHLIHLICLLRNLYVGQEATVGTGPGATGWFLTGKGVQQSFILSPHLFNFYAEVIM